MTQDEAYKAWWHNEGSGIIPLPNEDMEEFAHRITQIAWSNGAFMEREQILFAIKEVRGRSQEPVAWEQFYPDIGKPKFVAQTEQEPVAWLDEYGNAFPLAAKQYSIVGKHWKPLYTTPPQRKPLTDEEMKKIWYAMQNIMGWYSFEEVARAIEAAHNIKE